MRHLFYLRRALFVSLAGVLLAGLAAPARSQQKKPIPIKPDAPGLAPPIEAGPTLREVTWGVEGMADLDRLAALLIGTPHFADQRSTDGTLCARDPHGLGLVFRITQKRDPGVSGVPAGIVWVMV